MESDLGKNNLGEIIVDYIKVEEAIKMRASVAIASYNGAKYIKEQLESIIQQTVSPYEIVVSDDGSTDDTVAIVKDFYEKHKDMPIIFKLIENSTGFHGVTKNFENAMFHTTGDIIFLCDQDDVWFRNKIEKVMWAMSIHSEDLIIHDARLLVEKEDGIFRVEDETVMQIKKDVFDKDGFCKLEKEKYFFASFFTPHIQGMCMCVRRDFFLKTLPFSQGMMHDQWLDFCALESDSYLAIKDELSYYRIHSQNTCGIQKFKKERNLLDKIKTFNTKGKQAIRNLYVWHHDIYNYMREKEIPDKKVREIHYFYKTERINILGKSKLRAIKELCNSWKRGCYQIDGKIMLMHDIWFVIRYSKRYRRAFLTSIEERLRHNLVNETMSQSKMY